MATSGTSVSCTVYKHRLSVQLFTVTIWMSIIENSTSLSYGITQYRCLNRIPVPISIMETTSFSSGRCGTVEHTDGDINTHYANKDLCEVELFAKNTIVWNV